MSSGNSTDCLTVPQQTSIPFPFGEKKANLWQGLSPTKKTDSKLFEDTSEEKKVGVLVMEVPVPTLRKAFSQAEKSLSIFYNILGHQIRRVIELTGTEAHVIRIHRLIVDNAEILFWSLSLINLWQNWALFAAGAVAGLAIGTLGQRIGCVIESVQVLKTAPQVIGYNYFSTICLAVLAPWLSAFQGGMVSANYLVYPPVIQDKRDLANGDDVKATDSTVVKKMDSHSTTESLQSAHPHEIDEGEPSENPENGQMLNPLFDSSDTDS